MATATQILDAVDSAMLTLKSLADVPGVSLIPYVSTLSGVISVVHAAYSAGKNIEPYIKAISDTFDPNNPAPSQADLDALSAKIAELEAQIQEPLPPPEDGEPA